MTEKQYVVEDYFPKGHRIAHKRLIDKNTNKEVSLNLWDLANLLNHLHEENQQLRKENKELKLIIQQNEFAEKEGL